MLFIVNDYIIHEFERSSINYQKNIPKRPEKPIQFHLAKRPNSKTEKRRLKKPY